MRLELQDPTATLRDSYRGLVKEFEDRGERLVPFPLNFPHDDLPAFLRRLEASARGEDLPPGFVPHSTYWLVLDGREVVARRDRTQVRKRKMRYATWMRIVWRGCYRGAVFCSSQAVSWGSVNSPLATESMRDTTVSSGAVMVYPFRPRNTYIAWKATRLFPSMKG
jgi:hypothetical protein